MVVDRNRTMLRTLTIAILTLASPGSIDFIEKKRNPRYRVRIKMGKMVVHSISGSSSKSVALLLLLLSMIMKKENQLWAWIPLIRTTNMITGCTKYFCASRRISCFNSSTSLKLMTNPSPSSNSDEAAKAMTDYLAKSHEEKLKTLALLREKDSYIQKLSKELESFKAGALTTTASSASSSALISSTSSSAANADAAQDSIEEKLTAYQRFIANYIVKAQEEKNRAVQRAEAAIEKKYQDKLQVILQQSTLTSNADQKATTDQPVLKGTTTTAVTTPAIVATLTSSTATTTPPSRVNIGAAIAKGQFSTSEVHESVSTGPVDTSATTATLSSSPNILFEMRNTKLLEMAKEGRQSRWGEQEIQKLQKLSLGSSSSQKQPTSIHTSSNAPTTISLKDRLKFGAKLQPTTTTIASPSGQISANDTNLESLYSIRTVKVLESASAGKTRWGEAEIQKLSSNLSPATTTTTSENNENNLYQIRTTKVMESASAGKSRWGDAEIQKLSSSTTSDSATSVFQPITAAFLTRNNHVINVGAFLLSSYLLLGLSTAWASYQ